MIDSTNPLATALEGSHAAVLVRLGECVRLSQLFEVHSYLCHLYHVYENYYFNYTWKYHGHKFLRVCCKVLFINIALFINLYKCCCYI